MDEEAQHMEVEDDHDIDVGDSWVAWSCFRVV